MSDGVSDQIVASCGSEKITTTKRARPCRKCGFVFSTKECTECARRRGKEWRSQNQERQRANVADWRIRNPDAGKEWRQANPDRIAAIRIKSYAKNKEKADEASRKWKINNVERTRQHVREYAARHPDAAKLRAIKRRDELTDSYVAGVLGVPRKDAPANLLQIKREALTLKRLTKSLKTTLNETTKGEAK